MAITQRTRLPCLENMVLNLHTHFHGKLCFAMSLRCPCSSDLITGSFIDWTWKTPTPRNSPHELIACPQAQPNFLTRENKSRWAHIVQSWSQKFDCMIWCWGGGSAQMAKPIVLNIVHWNPNLCGHDRISTGRYPQKRAFLFLRSDLALEERILKISIKSAKNALF